MFLSTFCESAQGLFTDSFSDKQGRGKNQRLRNKYWRGSEMSMEEQVVGNNMCLGYSSALHNAFAHCKSSSFSCYCCSNSLASVHA